MIDVLDALDPILDDDAEGAGIPAQNTPEELLIVRRGWASRAFNGANSAVREHDRQ